MSERVRASRSDSSHDASGRDCLDRWNGSRPDRAMSVRRAVAVAGHTGDVTTARRGLVHATRSCGPPRSVRSSAWVSSTTSSWWRRSRIPIRRFAGGRPRSRRGIRASTSDRCSADPEPSVVEVAAWACGEHEARRRRRARGADLARHRGRGRRATCWSGSPRSPPSARSATTAGSTRSWPATDDRPAVRRRAVLALAPFLDPGHPRAAEVTAALDRARTDRDWQVRQAAEDLTD